MSSWASAMKDEQANPIEPGSETAIAAADHGHVTGAGSGTAENTHVYVSLKEMWEIYIKAVKSTDKSADNAKRQLLALDIFLELCCEEMDRSNTLPHFRFLESENITPQQCKERFVKTLHQCLASDVKSVCNQLCKEFMSDILHITTSSQDDDITQLQKYLLEGRGWILLKLIHKSGAQSVSGGRDLAKLLVSLLPWCLKFPLGIHGSCAVDGVSVLPLVSSCFQDVIKNLHGKVSAPKSSIPLSRQVNRGSQNSYSSNGNTSHDSGDKTKSGSKRKVSNRDQSDGSDSDEDTRTERSRGKIKRKHRFIYMRNSTDLHSQKVESEDEDEDIDLLLGKLHKEHRKTTGFELCVLILSLLQDLTLSDLEQVSPVKYLSPSILPDLLETLSSTELDTSVHDHEDEHEACVLIKRQILHVILTCSGIIAAQQNGVNILIGHKVVEKLLEVAQEMSSLDTKLCDGILQNKILLYKVNLLSDIIIGLLLCIKIVFECLPFNPTFIKSAKHLMEEFDENQGFENLQKLFHISDWLKCTSVKFDWMDDDPVKIFGSFLNTIKVVRVNYIHSMKCVKRKHQKCSYSEYYDHHHDILGVPSNQPARSEEDESLQIKIRSASQSSQTSQTPPSSQTVCMVAACTEVLLGVLEVAESKSMMLDILQVIYASGVCCCMNLEEVIKTFVASVGKFSPAVRSYALETMNKVILEHFSGGLKFGVSSQDVLCSYCENRSSRHSDTSESSIYSYFHKPVLDELKGLDSGFSSGEIQRSLILSTFHKLSKFRAVHLLRPLLYSDNEALAISIAKHLLVLAIKGNPYLKAELFFSLYMKTLRIFKTKDTQSIESSHNQHTTQESSQKPEDQLSKTVQVHCLSALPYLLQANCVTKAFLAQQGILKMCKLLEDGILRMPVLRVFEALIVLDEEKLDEGNDLGQADACPHPYKGGSVIDAFLEELSKRSFCSESESDSDTMGEESKKTSRRIRHNSVVCNRFSLPVLVDLWETCAKLSLHNRLFVSQFLLLDCLNQTENLLLETLEVLVYSCTMSVKSQASTETEDSGLEGEQMPGTGGRSEGNAFCMRVALMESLVVVIGACCEHLEKEGSVIPRTWQKVHDLFDGSYRYESSKLKMILDGLMNAGMPQYLSVLEYSYSRNIALVHMRDDDVYDEDEVRHLLQTGSESEYENLSTELGYDADSEETNFDESEKDKHMNWCLIRCHSPQKVYFPSVFKLLFNLMIMISKEESGKLVTSVLHKLLQNVRADKQLVQALCKEDILKLILSEDGFWTALIMKEEEGIAQDVLLGFVQQFGQQKISPPELQKFLQLFQHSDIPMENLLSVFLNIVENSHVAPQHYLEFPVRATGWVPAEWSEMMADELETSGTTIGPAMKNMSNMLMVGGANMVVSAPYADNQPVIQQEVWDACALKVSLKESLTWPPFQKGFSLALWVCLAEGQSNSFCPNMPLYNLETGSSERNMCQKSAGTSDFSTEKYLHLVSIGTREKMLEIWAHTGTYSLLFRLTSEVCSTGLAVQEAELKGIISPVTWQHLIFSYVESLDGSTLTGTANLVIDGWQDHTFSLDHPFSAIRPRHKSGQLHPQLFVGHAMKDIASNQQGSWSLGSLMLLKGANIPKETCFHLYSLGPNVDSILKCDCSEEGASYAPYLHKNTILHSKIPHDALVGLRKPDLTGIRSSLLLTYSSKQAKTVCIYTPLGKVPHSQASISLDTETYMLTQQPRLMTPVVQGDLLSQVSCTLEKAVEESGGVAAILFLVAKVYENCHDEMNAETAERLQSRALQVLFAVIHHSSRLQQEYISIGGHTLLSKVLTSCRSTVGYSVLKVLLDAATTESLFKSLPGTDTIAVRQKSEAVIRDATVIEHIVMNWNVWEGSHKDIMELLFQALANLVREDHPYQAFNIKQFQVINLVNKIFKIYQERIQDSLVSLPVSVGQSAITVIQNMIGSPPDYHMIMDICDFLLNVHPAAKTYISHSRSGFYFNLSWGIPPSPLSKWRLDQKALMTSTPVKRGTSLPGDTGSSNGKRNLLDSFGQSEKSVNRVQSHQEFPPVQVEDLTKPRSASDPLGPVKKGSSPIVFGPDIKKQDSLDKTAEEAMEAGADDGDLQNRGVDWAAGSSTEKSCRSSKHSSEEQDGSAALRARGLTIDGLWNISTDWDALYKRDGEPVQEWRDTKNSSGLVCSRTELDNQTEPVLGLGKTESSLRPQADKNGLESFQDFLGNELEIDGEAGDSDPDNVNREKVVYPSKENLSINFDESDADMAQAEEGLAALCVGLLQLLSTIIDMMPDSLSDKVFQKSIINPRTLIVLANSGSPEIRACVIKVLSSYLKRCSTPQIDMFLKMDGFQLLASQLFQYPTHHEQMDEAGSLVLQRNFKLDDGLQEGDCLDELSRVQQSSVCILHALLGNSTNDLALCHNSLQFCCQLFENSNSLATVMVDVGLIEVLSGMIQKLFENNCSSMDVEGTDENEILLSDILNFLKVIALREFRASGPQHYQHFEDILTLLKEMEIKEGEKHGEESKGVHTMRIFQHVIITQVFEMIEKASEEVSQQSFSIFPKQTQTSSLTNVLDVSSCLNSSAHSPTHSRKQSSLTHLQYALSGSFAKMALSRKSSPSFFLQPDHLPSETYGGSGGDSDSSSPDSLVNSVQTVNFPILRNGTSHTKGTETSQDRLIRSNSLLQSVLSIGKRRKLATIPISQNELIDRLKKVLTLAIDLTIFTDYKPVLPKKALMLFETSPHTVNIDRDFQRRLFNFTYRAFEATLQQEKSIYKRNKNVIMWGAKDVLRVQLGRLLAFMLSSKQEVDQRIYALSYIIGESRGSEVLRLIISSSDLGNDYAYLMYKLLTEGQQWLSQQQYEDGSKFINVLSAAGCTVLSPRKKQDIDYLQEKQRYIDMRHHTAKEIWLKRKESALQRILHKFDSLSSKLTDSAMEVTQVVSQLQTQERKKFITHLKQNMTDKVAVKKQWQELVQNLTHERAVWFHKNSYPQSWELNPTEGPCRVRKRLQRGHLGIGTRFLKKEAQYKLDSEQVDPPLIYLFEEDHERLSEAPALIYQLHINKKIRYTTKCTTVSPNSESAGELLIGEDSIFFVADEAVTDANYTQALLGNKDQLSMTWPFEDVVEIHRRWFELSDRGLEIFLTNGKTCLLAFDSSQDRDKLYQYLMMLELPNRRDTGNLFDGLDRWQNGQMTNFEYLTYLNKQAGRSFNDLMQYPVFPFILSDYTSEKIDLTDSRIYRDLMKPVSVQYPKNEQKFRDNYEILKAEYEKFGRAGMGSAVSGKPFHYGSHYSSSGTVLHFLVRLPPFTKMFINFQDQSFDIPDRTFHNLHTSWRLSSAESNTDVKELIPEFFFTHEFLLNSEGFNFGHRQTGDEVSDVGLPPWCKKNARQFMLIHRQALESDYVSDNITHWIDLVFGYKQQGEHAVKAINVFHPATYYGLDISSVKDVTERKAIQTMVRTYGQTPKQLFRVPHPPKKSTYQMRSHLGQQYKTVDGLKWGNYLGSPSQPDSKPVWEETYSSQVASLIPLPMGVVFGISPNSCLLAQYSQDKQQKAILSDDPGDVTWAAILTWGMSDGLVRIINGKNKPAVNFVQHSPFEEITCCVSVPDCRHLFIGGTSGVITFYNTKYNPAKESELQIFGHKKYLYGHTKTVTAMVVCRPYSMLVSASEDSTCIIWDLNRLSYVRSITSHKTEVKVVAISDTLGDIASVSRHGLGSTLHLHTVNAELVTTTTCRETINCLSYSNAPEGLSINVIAGGLSSGTISMWSSWDLSPVRELHHNSLLHTPIISLTFTHDSQRLFTSSSDGRVIVWDMTKQRLKSVRFRPFLYPADSR